MQPAFIGIEWVTVREGEAETRRKWSTAAQVTIRGKGVGAGGSVRGQSRTQAIRGWPGVRDWPGNGGPFAESATGLATIQKSKNYLSN